MMVGSTGPANFISWTYGMRSTLVWARALLHLGWCLFKNYFLNQVWRSEWKFLAKVTCPFANDIVSTQSSGKSMFWLLARKSETELGIRLVWPATLCFTLKSFAGTTLNWCERMRAYEFLTPVLIYIGCYIYTFYLIGYVLNKWFLTYLHVQLICAWYIFN